VDELAVVVVAACCLPLFVWAALIFLDRRVIEAFFSEARASRLLSEVFSSERRKATERAHHLLERNLNADQKRTFARDWFIDVRPSGGRVYRLAWSGSVGRLSEDEKSLTAHYCIIPTVGMPREDRLLALKLMLETDEEEFLRTAHDLGRSA
jgi:hypothetical protein